MTVHPISTSRIDEAPYAADTTVEVVLTARFAAPTGQTSRLAAELAESLRGVFGLSALEVGVPARSPLRVVPANRPVRIDAAARTVWLHDAELNLTRLEFDLLVFLGRNPGRVFTRPMLLDSVWKTNDLARTRTVDVHVRRLRAMLEPELKLITTVRGVGYRFDDTGQLSFIG